jgi:hypothetical protein
MKQRKELFSMRNSVAPICMMSGEVYKSTPFRMTGNYLRRYSSLKLKKPRNQILRSINMRSFFATLVAFLTVVAAAPTAELVGRDDLPCTPQGTCTNSTIGLLECCGTGFIDCTHRGFLFRDCGAGTQCIQPATGGLFCGAAS